MRCEREVIVQAVAVETIPALRLGLVALGEVDTDEKAMRALTQWLGVHGRHPRSIACAKLPSPVSRSQTRSIARTRS